MIGVKTVTNKRRFLPVAGFFLIAAVANGLVLAGNHNASAANGQAGIPLAPRQIMIEDFENRNTGSNMLLTDYTGADGQTYTADPYWVNRGNCNGFVIDATSPKDPVDCTVNYDAAGAAATYGFVQDMIRAIGQFNGGASPQTNAGLGEYTHLETTQPSNQGLIQFATAQNISLPNNNRFVVFSVDAAARNCAIAGQDPLLHFYRTENSTETKLTNNAINACTDSRGQNVISNIIVGRYSSDDSFLYTQPFGLVLRNETPNSNLNNAFGNDSAIDNIQVLDATPHLNKSFEPARVEAGKTSTLTITVTNTSELATKDGWGFTDNLPAGLAIASPSQLGGTCRADVTAGAGATSINVTSGVLLNGETSCTIVANVVSTDNIAPGQSKDYINGPGNFSDVIGVDLPNDAPVQFYRNPDAPATGIVNFKTALPIVIIGVGFVTAFVIAKLTRTKYSKR